MLKRFIKRFLPHKHLIQHHRHLKIFGDRIHHNQYWKLTPESVSRGLAVGIFTCWLPMPFQSILAAALALLIRGNLLFAVGAVFISNPITMAPMLYFAYKLGIIVLKCPDPDFHWPNTINGTMIYIKQFAAPIVTGTLICGIVSGILSYFLVRIIWIFLKNRK